MDGRARRTDDMPYTNGNLRAPPSKPEDLAVYVQTLLQEMTDKFTSMSSRILGRIDDLGGRIDDLEKQIEDLVQHTSADELQQQQQQQPGGACTGMREKQ